MMRRAAAAVAIGLLTISLTPGTAHAPQPAHLGPAVVVYLNNPTVIQVSTPEPASRDWRRPALSLAVGVPTVISSKDTTPARLAARPVPRALAPTANPTPYAPTLPRRSVTATPSQPSVTSTGEAAATGPRAYALHLVGPTAFRCLDQLWTRESNWRADADNPTSTAYGIAQLLTETSRDPLAQIRRGIAYIKARYRDACTALAHSLRENWY